MVCAALIDLWLSGMTVVKSQDTNVTSLPKINNSSCTSFYTESRQSEISSYCSPSSSEITYSNSLNVPNIDTSFKAYMDYRKITNKSSAQWSYRKKAITDENGMRRINDDYCVALGTYYTSSCGDRFKIVLDSGMSFTAIVCDIKDKKHTNNTNQYVPMNGNRGNLIEFIVDVRKLDKQIKSLGDVSSLGLNGNIIQIFKL